MINRLFPKTIDNNYHGYIIAKWAYYMWCLIVVSVSIGHMIVKYEGLNPQTMSIFEGISAEQIAMLMIFIHLWGSSQLVNSIIFTAVAIRYKALIPFMYLVCIFEFGFKLLIFKFKPIGILDQANIQSQQYIVIPILILLFVLSLRTPKGNL